VRYGKTFAAFSARLSSTALLVLPCIALGQARTTPEQRGGPPNPQTPRILVATFQSDDRRVGIDVAEAVRRRLQDSYSARDLYVVPKQLIDGALKPSGYAVDSALGQGDLMELGRQVRADEVLDARAARSAEGGVRIESRILLRRAATILSQPLPVAAGKNAGDAAKELERSLAEARKWLPGYQACENALRERKYELAAATARELIQGYAKSTLGRLCLLSAFAYSKAPPDSVIRVADELLTLDSLSVLALSNGMAAYKEKGNTEKVVAYGLRVWRMDPASTTIPDALVDQLVTAKMPERAIPIVEEMVKNNPGDARWLNKKLAVLLAAKQYKSAIAFSDTVAAADTSILTVSFYSRMGAAASLDSQPQLAAQIYARGLQKFPNDAGLHLVHAQALARSNQLEPALAAARRAVAIEPKIENGQGYLYVLGLMIQLDQVDSAMATAPKAIGAGADKERVGEALLAVVGRAIQKAQTSRARADWDAALTLAQDVDSMVPLPGTKFYIGFASFSVGSDAANEASELATQLRTARPAAAGPLRTRTCAALKVAEDNYATSAIATPRGASFNKDAAAQIMTGLQQADEFVKSAKQAFCR
jgi:hypothetical protein